MAHIILKDSLRERSINVAQHIYDKSARLQESGTTVDYSPRRESYLPLVSDNGYMTFHPLVTVSVRDEFCELFYSVAQKHHNRYLMSDTDDEARQWHDLYRLAEMFYQDLKDEEIVNGIVPEHIASFIKERNIKGYSSPKLSRLLVKLAGDTSPFTAWYTNKCPKKIEKGENTDYQVVVSVLPHHIAGMSYYSSYNHGGKRWNGWEGTSCQDPKRNSGGVAMSSLPASVKDETLAVAYLTHIENDDMWNPIMEARALIRVIEFSNGKVAYVVLRQFGYTESNAILIEGLKNQFNNVLVNNDIRAYGNDLGKCIKIHMSIADVRNITEGEECGRCDGDGHDEDGDDCYVCSGTGKVDGETFYPYNDDSDIWGFEGDGVKITYRIPKKMLLDKGLYGEVEIENEPLAG